jgi:hypothetical protein
MITLDNALNGVTLLNEVILSRYVHYRVICGAGHRPEVGRGVFGTRPTALPERSMSVKTSAGLPRSGMTAESDDEPAVEIPIREFDKYADNTGYDYFRWAGCGIGAMHRHNLRDGVPQARSQRRHLWLIGRRESPVIYLLGFKTGKLMKLVCHD